MQTDTGFIGSDRILRMNSSTQRVKMDFKLTEYRGKKNFADNCIVSIPVNRMNRNEKYEAVHFVPASGVASILA